MRPLTPLLVLAAVAGPAWSQTVFEFALNNDQEVPPIAGNANGFATVTLDTATGAVSVSGFYTGLTGIATAAHLHGPAPAGANGPVVLALNTSGGFTGQVSGNGVLSPQQVTDMLSGLHDLNVHSTAHLGGEVRGQVVAAGFTVPYGSGVNPSGSLVVVSGTPVAGWGMASPAGALLIGVLPPDPALVLMGPAWTGPGNPAPIPPAIPSNANLVGKTFFAQGLLLDLLGTPEFALAEARELHVGS